MKMLEKSAGARFRGGFTLVELLVTIAIAAILAVIAVPSFNDLALRSKLNAVANSFVASAHLARSEAIKRNAAVTLCASSDAETCKGDWKDGWIVLAGDVVIHKQAAIPKGFVLSGGDVKSINFLSTGVGADSASLTLCRATPTVGGRKKTITVTATGRPSAETEDASSCP